MTALPCPRMDLRRLRAGEWITAACGVALLVSLFLPWYEAPRLTGWEALAALDLVLALVALCALALLLLTAGQRVPAVPIAFSVLVTYAGMAAVILVAARALSLPDGAQGREWGLWLALAAALGIVAGGLVAMRDERPSRPGEHTDQAGGPVPAPPEIETISAPRP